MKKLFSMLLVVICTALVLSGCSLQEKVGSAANTLVSNYCTKPNAERALVRLWIDQATSPNQIRIHCATDQSTPEPTTPEAIEQ